MPAVQHSIISKLGRSSTCPTHLSGQSRPAERVDRSSSARAAGPLGAALTGRVLVGHIIAWLDDLATLAGPPARERKHLDVQGPLLTGPFGEVGVSEALAKPLGE